MEETGYDLVHLCSGCCPAVLVDQLKPLHVFLQTPAVNCLCENICWVVCSQHLMQLEVARGETILHPEFADCQMSNFS